MRTPVRAALTSGGAWLLGAAASVTVGLVALSLIGGGLGAHGVTPLTSTDTAANADLGAPNTSPSSAPPAGSSPAPNPSNPGPASTTSEQVLHSVGGFVVARCQLGRAYLVSWTPEQGYETHDVRRGPAGTASVEFEGAQGHVRLDVTCDNGAPHAHVQQADDDGGGE